MDYPLLLPGSLLAVAGSCCPSAGQAVSEKKTGRG